MTINATINIRALDANVGRIGTTIPPPFGRAKQSYDWGAGCNSDVSRTGISANVNF